MYVYIYIYMFNMSIYMLVAPKTFFFAGSYFLRHIISFIKISLSWINLNGLAVNFSPEKDRGVFDVVDDVTETGLCISVAAQDGLLYQQPLKSMSTSSHWKQATSRPGGWSLLHCGYSWIPSTYWYMLIDHIYVIYWIFASMSLRY